MAAFDFIEVRGARENNLRDVSLDIPKRAITVGTATDAYAMLRLVYSRVAEPHVGPSFAFSFNDPQGMCPHCEGMGRVSTVDVEALVDRSRSLDEGAITLPGFGVDSWPWRMYAESGFFDPGKRLADYSDAEREQFLHGPETKVVIRGLNLKWEGLVGRFERTFLSKDVEIAQPHIRAAIERVATFATCPECHGARLNQAALGARIAGRNIAECAAMQIDDLAGFLAGIEAPGVAPALAALRHTLESFVEVGLGYLSLHRESATLSGGEAQRVKMVRPTYTGLLDAQGVREGQRRQARAVQRELGGRLPGVQGQRRHLHRPRLHGRGGDRLRGLRGQALHARRPGVQAARREHRRRAGDVRGGRGEVLHGEGRPADARRAGRRGPRLRATGPAAHDAVRRGAPAHQARH